MISLSANFDRLTGLFPCHNFSQTTLSDGLPAALMRHARQQCGLHAIGDFCPQLAELNLALQGAEVAERDVDFNLLRDGLVAGVT